MGRRVGKYPPLPRATERRSSPSRNKTLRVHPPCRRAAGWCPFPLASRRPFGDARFARLGCRDEQTGTSLRRPHRPGPGRRARAPLRFGQRGVNLAKPRLRARPDSPAGQAAGWNGVNEAPRSVGGLDEIGTAPRTSRAAGVRASPRGDARGYRHSGQPGAGRPGRPFAGVPQWPLHPAQAGRGCSR